MSFFSMLGLTPLDFCEGNHGELESQNMAVSNETVTADPMQHRVTILQVVTNPVVPNGFDSPQTATHELYYGTNCFSSKQIVVARGYHILFDTEMRDVLNLYIERIQDGPLRVAQVTSNEYIRFTNMEHKKKIRNTIKLFPGVHVLQTPIDDEEELDFYFLSKHIF